MFGGFNTSPPEGGHLLSDFWRFDSENGWQQLEGECDFELCVEGYPDVVGLAFYDPLAEAVVLINDTGRGTFAFDPGTEGFQDLDVTGPAGAAGAALAYDAESQVAVLFGGLNFSGFVINDDTWSFEPGTSSWTQMEPPEAPGIGNYHAMAYDPVSDRMILFGGAGPGDRPYGETWAYDYNTDAWTNLEPKISPPARYYSDMVYDAGQRKMILFGGTSEWGSATFNDTWTYDPASNEWNEIDAPGPSIRAWHSMAYDDASGKIVLFGGGLVREDYQADTWLFDSDTNTWQEMTITQ
jgi:N-acetylneuraminic acid mutarotase